MLHWGDDKHISLIRLRSKTNEMLHDDCFHFEEQFWQGGVTEGGPKPRRGALVFKVYMDMSLTYSDRSFFFNNP